MRLLLLHAFPADERMWDRQRETLDCRDVIVPRLYGRGSSFDEWAASLLREIDGEFVAVGASMGGYAALAIARADPQRLTALVLVGARVETDSPERLKVRAETLEQLRTHGATAVWSQDDLTRAPPTEDLIAAVEALRDRPDATETVRALTCPLLVVVGETDPLMSLEEGRAVAGLARHGHFEPAARAGHLVSLDQPSEFNRVLIDFLGSV